MAEFLLRKSLVDGKNQSATRFELSSAGTRGLGGVGMDPRTAEELRRLSASPDRFHSQVLTYEDCADADLILTSTLTQRSDVLARYPGALRRTFTLLEFAKNAPRVYDKHGRAWPSQGADETDGGSPGQRAG